MSCEKKGDRFQIRPHTSKTAVIGVGNILMRDDGVGVHVVRELERGHHRNGVRYIDGGTAAFGALDEARDCDVLIIVDAVKAGGEPGTVYRMDLDEWRTGGGVSLHDVGLLDAISTAKMVEGRDLSVSVIGIEPEEISPGLELSISVRERFEKLMDCVLEEIRELEGRGDDGLDEDPGL